MKISPVLFLVFCIIFNFDISAQNNNSSICIFGFDSEFTGIFVDSNSNEIYIGTAIDSVTLDQKLICLKTDVNGTPIWSLAASNPNYSQGYKIAGLSNGDYIVSGIYESFGVSGELMLARISNSGSVIWSKVYQIASYYLTDADICVDSNDNIIVACSKGAFSNSKGVVFKVDSNGQIIWSNQYSNQSLLVINKIIPAINGGYLIGGLTAYSNYSGYLLKIDSLGNPEWGRKINADTALIINSIFQLPNGEIYAVGTANYLHSPDYVLIKLDDNGNLLNSWTYESTFDDIASDFSLNNTGNGFLISGTSSFFGPLANNLGSVILEVDLNGNLNNYWFIQQPNYLYTTPKAMAINGNRILQCGKMYRFTNPSVGAWIHQTGLSNICHTYPITFTPRQSIITDSTGYSVSPLTISSLNITFNVNTTMPQIVDYCSTSSLISHLTHQDIFIYPNPSMDQININFNNSKSEEINLQIIKSSGSIEFDKNYFSGDNTNINISNLESGLYIVRAVSINCVFQSKFIKL